MTELRRRLGLASAIAVVVGSMIGSGILGLPGQMLEELPSPVWVLGVFVIGALITIVGALTVAELSAMHPKAGGQYVFLREAFGPGTAYLYGWANFWVIMSGTIAAIAVLFADFVGRFVDLPWTATPLSIGGWETGITLPGYGQAYVAIAAILLLAVVNRLGVQYAGSVQNATTIVKVGGLVLLVAGALFFVDRAEGSFEPIDPAGGQGLGLGIAAALPLALFAYDGWYQATYVAAEVRNPKRDVPLALVLGSLAVAAVYLLVSTAYFWVQPLDAALAANEAGDSELAARTAQAIVGWGADAITWIAIIGLAGSLNAFILTAPRITYAMAQDGAFLKSMGKLHPKYATPSYGTWMIALWSCILVMTGLFDQIATMAVFGVFMFHVPTALAQIVLRRRHPDAERPFRTPFHPVVPLLFLFAGVAVLAFVVATYFVQAVIATVLIAAGVPAYLMQRRRGPSDVAQ